jgi:uncharacterized protein YeaO (DUF488 family)
MATASRGRRTSTTAARRRKSRTMLGGPRGGSRSAGSAVRRGPRKIGSVAIELRRAYDPPAQDDGPRVLVDRVWPRGLSKEKIKIDAWLRDLGPSTALRKWFGHDLAKWEEFRARYRKELAAKRPLLDELAAQARDGKLTLVFGARDPVHNQAVVIKEVLEGKRRAG